MSQGFTKGIPIDTDVTLSPSSDFLVPSQNAVKTYVDTRTLMLGETQGLITHTGTAVETKIFSIAVPANKVGNNDIIEVQALARRTSGSGTIQIDIYFNETDDLTTPQRVGQVVTAASQTILSHNYQKWLNTNNSTAGTPNHGMSSVFGTAAYTTTINNTTTFYIVFSCTLGTAGDTGTIYFANAILHKA